MGKASSEMTSPFPEVFFDVGDVAAAGDVFERFIVNSESEGTLDRFTVLIGDTDFDAAFGTWFESCFVRKHFNVKNTLFRWHDDLAHRGVELGR